MSANTDAEYHFISVQHYLKCCFILHRCYSYEFFISALLIVRLDLFTSLCLKCGLINVTFYSYKHLISIQFILRFRTSYFTLLEMPSRTTSHTYTQLMSILFILRSIICKVSSLVQQRRRVLSSCDKSNDVTLPCSKMSLRCPSDLKVEMSTFISRFTGSCHSKAISKCSHRRIFKKTTLAQTKHVLLFTIIDLRR